MSDEIADNKNTENDESEKMKKKESTEYITLESLSNQLIEAKKQF